MMNTAITTDSTQNFDIISVDQAEYGDHYIVRARVPGIGTTTWLGLEAIDGTLTCTGWSDASEWVDPQVVGVSGWTVAVVLGCEILAAARV